MFLVMHFSPAFLEQPTPFPHIRPVHCAITLHFNNVPENFLRMSIFSVQNSYHRPHFTAGFSISCSSLTNTANVPLHIQKTTDLHRKCARHLRGRYARSVPTFWTGLVLCACVWVGLY
jgi:hypothetical protein